MMAASSCRRFCFLDLPSAEQSEQIRAQSLALETNDGGNNARLVLILVLLPHSLFPIIQFLIVTPYLGYCTL